MSVRDPHEWDDANWGATCIACGCTIEEFMDNLRPQCHPVGNWLVLSARGAKLRWNRAVRITARFLTIE